MNNATGEYLVYGLNQSYFTRKMTGYLDYKRIPWQLRRSAGMNPELRAAGWSGGIPPVATPDGTLMWDSTAMIHHLDERFPERSVLPPDPLSRFLCYVVEDVADEWLYRTAVGSRWFLPENAGVGGYELARDMSVEAPLSCDDAHAMVGAYVRSSCPPLGVTETTIATWIDEVLKPWLRTLGAHFAARPFLFGERPSLADFAIFGGSAAHYVNDPLCRRWTETEGPALVAHTHRLLEPDSKPFGDWNKPGDVPDTLIAVLADFGRLYLPWVSRATVDGSADLVFRDGTRVPIRATDFLVEARSVLLARYVALRSRDLDAVLERAGILSYFADFTAQAGSIPSSANPPRPALNQPYPPAQ
jgi:glutathione S-transferase